MPLGDGRVAVAVGDHFALLGDAQAAVDGAGRLRQDGPVGRPAAAADRAAAAVEDLHGHAGAAHQFAQLALRPVQRPGRLQEPASLLLSE